MSHRLRFRFGVQHYPATSGHQWKERARQAEALGYDTFVMPDHIGQGGLAYAPALMAAADATTTLRIGTLVLDNDFRHPALVASEVATLDLLSDGRFELGIGAGWDPTDYEASGIEFDAPAVRVDRFEESIQIIKQLLAGDPVTFNGRHYTVRDLQNAPSPVQRPRPPLLIGAAGPRLLAIAAQEADIISIMPPGIGSPEGPDVSAAALMRNVERVRETSGDRFDRLELSTLLQRLVITDSVRDAARELADQWQVALEDALACPWVLFGSVDQISDSLHERRERFGLSYWVVPGWYMEDFAPVIARLAGE